MSRPVIDVPIRLLDESLGYPAYAHPGDAGFDVRSAVDATLEPFQRATIPCGFAIAVPEGFGGFVIPRSGLASKHGISIVNAPGLVDSGYRGEVMAVLINLDPENAFHVHRGDRIAQMAIIETPAVNLVETTELDETLRGKNGFGSSGI